MDHTCGGIISVKRSNKSSNIAWLAWYDKEYVADSDVEFVGFKEDDSKFNKGTEDGGSPGGIEIDKRNGPENRFKVEFGDCNVICLVDGGNGVEVELNKATGVIWKDCVIDVEFKNDIGSGLELSSGVVLPSNRNVPDSMDEFGPEISPDESDDEASAVIFKVKSVKGFGAETEYGKGNREDTAGVYLLFGKKVVGFISNGPEEEIEYTPALLI